ncbi:MAG: tetratricopeptide repeat protein [Candidatus Methylumidiphilus sp.]
MKKHPPILPYDRRKQEKPARLQAAVAVSDELRQAIALHQQGRLGPAETLYRAILQLRPNDFDALHLLGVVMIQKGRPGQAVGLISQALAANPAHPAAHLNLGNALQDLRRYEDALASFGRALELQPDYVEAMNNSGRVLQDLKRYEDALGFYSRALRIKPDYGKALANRGIALHHLMRFEEALASYEQALRATPGDAETLNNQGAALCAIGRIEEGLACYAQAAQAQPGLADPHWHDSLIRLLLGDFGQGWKKHEWRWQTEAFASLRRDFRQPPWLGEESLRGKTILLHAEQGLGDTIQFCRYAKHVAAAGATVLLEVQTPGLMPLLAKLDGVSQTFVRGEALPDFDCHCPLLSLPLAFGTTLDTIPADPGYLAAAPERIDAWRAKLGATELPRIGLAWSGNTAHINDRARSIPLAQFARLAAGPAQFISVQQEVRDSDNPTLQAHPEIAHFGGDLTDFGETAALIANLDLVVTIDTSVAHLAAAMGKPTWLLLAFMPDWRWLLDRDDSPWYPTVRLFRQPGLGDWDGAIANAGRALAALIQAAA